MVVNDYDSWSGRSPNFDKNVMCAVMAVPLTHNTDTIGSGSQEVELTITSGGFPVDGAAVWITTDLAGSNVIAGTLYTDGSGNVTFMLDVGTYYVWKQRNGHNFTNPETLAVT